MCNPTASHNELELKHLPITEFSFIMRTIYWFSMTKKTQDKIDGLIKQNHRKKTSVASWEIQDICIYYNCYLQVWFHLKLKTIWYVTIIMDNHREPCDCPYWQYVRLPLVSKSFQKGIPYKDGVGVAFVQNQVPGNW